MKMDEEGKVYCLGDRCFTIPYEDYVLPPFYRTPLLRGEKFPGRDFRWKISYSIKESTDESSNCFTHSRIAIQRAFAFPHCLGLGNEGRWKWKWVPISIITGAKLNFKSPFSIRKQRVDDSQSSVSLLPSLRIKILSPVFGKLDLKPSLELLPTPSLSIKRLFSIGKQKLNIEADVKFNLKELKWPQCIIQLHSHPSTVAKFVSNTLENGYALNYKKGFQINRDLKAEISGKVDIPFSSPSPSSSSSSLSSSSLTNSKSDFTDYFHFESFKISQVIGTRGKRDPPRRVRTYLQGSNAIGKRDDVAVIPGHWIDPGFEPGAPGEREFNLDVADAVERQLYRNRWKVLRPDRDAPGLRWEEYLNWVSRQSLRGVPVLEIHGQGSLADYRGLVLGILGDKDAPLSKELSKSFGTFPMDWRELAVPRRGGAILESFNSDEVLQMAPWHRKWAVSRLANRISTCIERASAPNRRARGIFVECDHEENFLSARARSVRKSVFNRWMWLSAN